MREFTDVTYEVQVGLGQMAYSSLKMFSETAEAREGITAFNEKRSPDFSAYRGN